MFITNEMVLISKLILKSMVMVVTVVAVIIV